METVSFTRQLSVAENVDVLVVGAGPAGIGAAVCAARNGARTLDRSRLHWRWQTVRVL